MNREELYKKLSDIHLLYSMPYKAENMRPEHYAIKGYEKLAYEQCAEIERLNNIINELEKFINSYYAKNGDYDAIDTIASEILNKLKELKGE